MIALLNRRYTVVRRTAFVLDAATLGLSHSGSRTPAEPFAVEVEISGSGTAGTVTVSGTVSGAAGSQQLAFSAAGRNTTTKLFDANTAVTFTTSGFVGTWTISARAVKRDGSGLKFLRSVVTSWPGRQDRRRGTWPASGSGSNQREQPVIFVKYTTTWTPREGDELVDEKSGERWRVESVPPMDGLVVTHHWELSVHRAED